MPAVSGQSLAFLSIRAVQSRLPYVPLFHTAYHCRAVRSRGLHHGRRRYCVPLISSRWVCREISVAWSNAWRRAPNNQTSAPAALDFMPNHDSRVEFLCHPKTDEKRNREKPRAPCSAHLRACAPIIGHCDFRRGGPRPTTAMTLDAWTIVKTSGQSVPHLRKSKCRGSYFVGGSSCATALTFSTTLRV